MRGKFSRGARVMLLAAASALAGTAAGATPPLEFHDLMPAFWQFWGQAEGRSQTEQWEIWRRLYYGPNREVLDVLPCSELKVDTGPVARFANVTRLAPAMHAIADRVQTTVPIAERRFLRLFPDMRWNGAVYLLYSGGCFDGRPAEVHGKSALMFGTDVIAKVGETDLIPLMQHELFHVYHAQFFTSEDPFPLWEALWEEGLAVYAAQALNPQTANVNLLTKDDLVAAVDSRRQNLAADFLRRFSSTVPADYTLYFDGSSVSAEVPTRAGYRLGYLVARHLAITDHYSLPTMAHWTADEAEPHVAAALQALSKGGTANS